jgi:hypothetical protein
MGLSCCSEGLDWIIQQAGSRGIRLLLTFTTYRAFPDLAQLILDSQVRYYLFGINVKILQYCKLLEGVEGHNWGGEHDQSRLCIIELEICLPYVHLPAGPKYGL